jgi:antitoxin component YwqK of YwqJK toxin-antitoxin module
MKKLALSFVIASISTTGFGQTFNAGGNLGIPVGDTGDVYDFTIGGDIDYKDIMEKKGLLYLKADTTLVTGRVIRYNRKKEVKCHILVVNGIPDKSGWISSGGDELKEPMESDIGSLIVGAAWVTGATIALTGNEIDVPVHNSDYHEAINNNRDDISGTKRYLLKSGKNISKAYKEASERNDISNDLKSQFETSTGSYEEYYDNGQLEIEKHYLDGKKDGVWERYHSNGNLESRVNFVTGIQDGLYEEYYYDGQLEIRVNYVNGEKDGLWVEYHDNGQLWSKGYYDHGRKTGKWEYFDKDGELLGTENYD